MLSVPWRGWYSAEYNIPSLVFCLSYFHIGCMGRLQKLNRSWCSCGQCGTRRLRSRSLSLAEAKSSPKAPAVPVAAPPHPPDSSCSHQVDPEVLIWVCSCFFFHPWFFNSVSTDSCRQMWAHPAQTPGPSGLVPAPVEKPRSDISLAQCPSESACWEGMGRRSSSLHWVPQPCPGKLRTSSLSQKTDRFFLNTCTGMKAKGFDHFRKGPGNFIWNCHI